MCYNMLNKGECNFPGCTFAHSEKERRKPKQVKKLEHGRYYNENAPLVYNYWHKMNCVYIIKFEF